MTYKEAVHENLEQHKTKCEVVKELAGSATLALSLATVVTTGIGLLICGKLD